MCSAPSPPASPERRAPAHQDSQRTLHALSRGHGRTHLGECHTFRDDGSNASPRPPIPPSTSGDRPPPLPHCNAFPWR
ncbi:hypothetical protein K438DRAFT_1810270 [Mycena galopus ATCC 62051]|nr:hypothetical protein K438DRAFT_1810270 [Mycena galopus ATCC 62051]